MFSKYYVDKEVNKPLKYKVDHAKLCDGVRNQKKIQIKKNMSKHLTVWSFVCFIFMEYQKDHLTCRTCIVVLGIPVLLVG